MNIRCVACLASAKSVVTLNYITNTCAFGYKPIKHSRVFTLILFYGQFNDLVLVRNLVLGIIINFLAN